MAFKTSTSRTVSSGKASVMAVLVAVGLASAGTVTPAFAASPLSVDSYKLDNAPAAYSYYRNHRGWRGHRGGAIAAGVGLGVLGAAAIAASRPAYAGGYYADEGYSYYEPRPSVYYAPAPVYREPVYGAPAYYEYRSPDRRYGSRNGTTDPARGGR